jgi:hypothetical protein
LGALYAASSQLAKTQGAEQSATDTLVTVVEAHLHQTADRARLAASGFHPWRTRAASAGSNLPVLAAAPLCLRMTKAKEGR